MTRGCAIGLIVCCASCIWCTPLQASDELSPAWKLWQKGQASMRQGRAKEAVGFYQQSLAADPGFLRNHLSLAAAYLELGDEKNACPHLTRYVAAYPEQYSVRGHLAELLLRLQRHQEARQHFERYEQDLQEQVDNAHALLVHCHTRLMEIAEHQNDEYREHLHRGIGLYYLATQRAAVGDADAALAAEGFFCKAAAELNLAHLCHPDACRPCWYLHQVWAQLCQRQSARHWLEEAHRKAPFAYLTSMEKRSLFLAYQSREGNRSTRR